MDMFEYFEQLKSKINEVETTLNELKKKLNETEQKMKQNDIDDKYKLKDFRDYLKEFNLEDKFNRCKTEDERYDIYASYTRARLSKVHPPEYFKKQEKDIDSGVFSTKPQNNPEDNATFIRKRPKCNRNKEQKESYKITIENDNLLNSYDKGQIILAIKKLPTSLIKMLNNKGYKIKVVPGSELGDGVAGIHNNGTKTIKLSFDCNNNKDDVFLHELGHMLDFNAGYPLTSNSTEFIKIYKYENIHFFDQSSNLFEHHSQDPKEYFAESFREYILEPWKLKSNAPKTYEFMKRYIENL